MSVGLHRQCHHSPHSPTSIQSYTHTLTQRGLEKFHSALNCSYSYRASEKQWWLMWCAAAPWLNYPLSSRTRAKWIVWKYIAHVKSHTNLPVTHVVLKSQSKKVKTHTHTHKLTHRVLWETTGMHLLWSSCWNVMYMEALATEYWCIDFVKVNLNLDLYVFWLLFFFFACRTVWNIARQGWISLPLWQSMKTFELFLYPFGTLGWRRGI